MAEYFASGRRRILTVEPESDGTLLLRFDSGEIRRLDVKPLISSESVFGFLADPSAFRRVYLDENAVVSWDKDPEVDSTLIWSNKLDLDPDVCYVDSVPV